MATSQFIWSGGWMTSVAARKQVNSTMKVLSKKFLPGHNVKVFVLVTSHRHYTNTVHRWSDVLLDSMPSSSLLLLLEVLLIASDNVATRHQHCSRRLTFDGIVLASCFVLSSQTGYLKTLSTSSSTSMATYWRFFHFYCATSLAGFNVLQRCNFSTNRHVILHLPACWWLALTTLHQKSIISLFSPTFLTSSFLVVESALSAMTGWLTCFVLVSGEGWMTCQPLFSDNVNALLIGRVMVMLAVYFWVAA